MLANRSRIDAPDEAQRQAVLDSHGALDTLPEQACDEIVLLAAALCATPAAAIALIDHGRQWSKAQIGVDYLHSPCAQDLCDAAIANPTQMLVVEDIAQARADLKQRHQALQQTASRDQLTGLLNRTALAQLRENPRAMQKLERAP